MVKFSKSFASFVLLACSALAVASPMSSLGSGSSQLHATRRALPLSDKLTLEIYHPESTYETYGTGLEDSPARSASGFDLAHAATSFVTSRSRSSAAAPTVAFRNGYEGEAAHHAYLVQQHDGIPFANTAANVVFNKDQKVVAYGSSFVNPKQIASSNPSVPLTHAISTAERTLNGKYNNHPAKLEYFVKPDETVVLAHVVQIENEETGAWYEAFVDAHDNALVSVTDFVADATYLVLPVYKESPTEGFEVVTDPQDLRASPIGWHQINNGTVLHSTEGNNIFTTVATSESSSGLNFIYKADLTKEPTVSPNPDASRTNVFYIVNSLHDITYLYGFTEAAANFQNNNFGKGGEGNDRVSVSVQDTGGINNANFATPADGQSGRMRMYLWNYAGTPQRDGAIQNDVITHEFTHGVSNRLTGGGTARCLQTTESRGMGEGWSDAMANWVEKTSAAVNDFAVGPWVFNRSTGLRDYPYSTNPAVNPLRYSDLQTRTEVHDIGEVWANMLHNVYANLVASRGFSTKARSDPTTTEGNVVHMHLYLDAMMIQPCNPTFITARDAWIQADVNRYGGANACAIWKAFASRGLGVGAANHVNSFVLPPACQ